MTGPDHAHLPLQQHHLPEVYRAITIFNVLSALALFAIYTTIWRGPGRNQMQLVIIGVFLYKAFINYLDWGHVLMIQSYGQAGFWADLVPKIMDRIQNVVELELFLLLALGYKVLRGRLGITEIRFLIGIAIISLYLGIFEVVESLRTKFRMSSCVDGLPRFSETGNLLLDRDLLGIQPDSGHHSFPRIPGHHCLHEFQLAVPRESDSRCHCQRIEWFLDFLVSRMIMMFVLCLLKNCVNMNSITARHRETVLEISLLHAVPVGILVLHRSSDHSDVRQTVGFGLGK